MKPTNHSENGDGRVWPLDAAPKLGSCISNICTTR